MHWLDLCVFCFDWLVTVNSNISSRGRVQDGRVSSPSQCCISSLILYLFPGSHVFFTWHWSKDVLFQALLKKHVSFDWAETQQEDKEALKAKLKASCPALAVSENEFHPEVDFFQHCQCKSIANVWARQTCWGLCKSNNDRSWAEVPRLWESLISYS